MTGPRPKDRRTGPLRRIGGRSLAALIALAARTPLPVLKGLFRAAAGAAFVLGIRRRVVVE
ncbi:MAG: hypothetical protein ACM3NF_04160, partial [Gemmatimonadota bacterium]